MNQNLAIESECQVEFVQASIPFNYTKLNEMINTNINVYAKGRYFFFFFFFREKKLLLMGPFLIASSATSRTTVE